MDLILITQNQREQIIQLMKDVIDALKLDKDSAQRVIEESTSMQAMLKGTLREFLFSTSNTYKDDSSSVYRSYRYSVKPLAKQIYRLNELFPNISYADVQLGNRQLPNGAEGWFAIPRWNKIAKNYNEAVEKVLIMLKQTLKGNFYNHCEGELGPQYLRHCKRTAWMLDYLSDRQHGDVLIVPAQFGMRHHRNSIFESRKNIVANEFGLGVFEVGIMLLTHPERLMSSDTLWIDCAGDKYSPQSKIANWSYVPTFIFLDDKLRFDASWCGHPNNFCFGSVSAFFP